MDGNGPALSPLDLRLTGFTETDLATGTGTGLEIKEQGNEKREARNKKRETKIELTQEVQIGNDEVVARQEK
jgi:hypothetical protein